MPGLSPFSLITTAAGLAGGALLLRAFQTPEVPKTPRERSPSTNGSAALAIADLDTTQQHRTRRTLRVTRGWGALSTLAGAAGLLLSRDASARAFYGLHFTCGLLTTTASQAGLSFLRRRPDPSYITQERLALADLTVASAATGVGALMAKNDTPALRGAGQALIIQSAFIGALDTLFYVQTRATRKQLESHLTPIARRLPLEATLH